MLLRIPIHCRAMLWCCVHCTSVTCCDVSSRVVAPCRDALECRAMLVCVVACHDVSSSHLLCLAAQFSAVLTCAVMCHESRNALVLGLLMPCYTVASRQSLICVAPACYPFLTPAIYSGWPVEATEVFPGDVPT